MRSIMKYIIPAVLFFAFIGLGYELIFNPLGFLTRILMIVGFVAVIFLGYRWFMSRKYGTPLFPSQTGPSRAQLRKAKKTSTKRSSTPVPAPATFKPRTTNMMNEKKKTSRPKNRRDGHNLTVIEGKKNKKKKRAFF
ncbi:SA1362 family protein [Halalkalibacter okhensis]|uniref:SA1362 family protein n=1 Tax=Halalkalibacter okhensis TaxID=333138 RepID=UPI00068EB36D|nr:SA1362 family protein [Halalkalibacter okhensis]